MFLPVSKKDMEERGIDRLDFVYIIGDAYVDHSSFGPAIISRVLVSRGYTVGIISQPDWRDEDSISALGEPRLAFIISSGNMDSMVNHYTVNKKRRSMDAYSPGGKVGLRPDHATVVYSNLVRKSYRDVPIIIGGIEASLRRMAHYDYWSDRIKRSILLDSGADILSYGMGERSITELADALAAGIAVKDITFVRGTVYKARDTGSVADGVILPPFDRVRESKEAYAGSFKLQYENTDPYTAHPLVEEYDHSVFVIQNPPAYPLTQMEMDDIYSLPYMNRAHPMYDEDIPAISEIKFSLTSSRGCFGGCSFCALTFHQGRILQTRSHGSIVDEAIQMTKDPQFKGYIHDVGGPTANFRHPSCQKQLEKGVCKNRQCLFPKPCGNLKVDHSDYVALLKRLRELPGVKKVFVRSGIRYDYLMADRDDTFLRQLIKHHISGQLRVAPEHITDRVLALMGKPGAKVYEGFISRFESLAKKDGREQFVVPYLMSSHPGSEMTDAIALAEYVRDLGYMPEQVQDFYPTPSTLSTVMYYTGLDPRTMERVYVERNPHRKAMQRALIQYRKPENYALVKEALLSEGRGDLIGYGKECLIPPRPYAGSRPGNKSDRDGGINNGRKSDKGRKDSHNGENRRAGKQRDHRSKGVHGGSRGGRNKVSGKR